ncbi:hypothetical protein [Lentibacillus jeotgali]|uniref:hypothetical protein n=1 Tax=Lentibacillus jeotgali TaxID=558169 RepID=UPI0002628878|nr:hypothetical protein [Lentibacillus jeotgali]
MKKISSLILSGFLLFTVISVPIQSVSAQSTNNVSVSQSEANMINMTDKTKEIADTYVEVKNKKFIIKNQTELKNSIGEEQFKEVLKQIEYTNKQLSQIDLSHASVDNNKNTVKVNADFKQTSDGPQILAGIEGKDDIKFHWTYAEIWLSDSTSESIIKIGTNAVTTALGGISGRVAGAVAGAVVGGSINEFVAGKVSKAVYFKMALVPPFHTWDIQSQ